MWCTVGAVMFDVRRAREKLCRICPTPLSAELDEAA